MGLKIFSNGSFQSIKINGIIIFQRVLSISSFHLIPRSLAAFLPKILFLKPFEMGSASIAGKI